MAQVSGTKEAQLREHFLVGLCKEIRTKIRPRKPKDLSTPWELTDDFEEAKKEGNLVVELRSLGFHFQHKGGMWIHSVGGSVTNTFHNTQRQNRTLRGDVRSSSNVMAANQSESMSSGS